MSSSPPISSSGPAIPSPSLRRSNSLPSLRTQTSTGSLAATDSVSLENKVAPTEQAAKEAAKTGKRFYQPILDFFVNTYQKLMDFFTPTSKAAIEKSLAKAQLKSELYEIRIHRSQIALAQKGISNDVQAILTKDGQKAAKKLEALTPKIEKLAARYEKLIGATTAPTTTSKKAAAASTSASTSEGVGQTARSTVADAAEETAEGLEKSFQTFAENLANQGEEVAEKLKQKPPEFIEGLQKLFTGILK